MAIKCPVHNVFTQEIALSPSGNGFVCWCPIGGCLISGNRNSRHTDIKHPERLQFRPDDEDWGDIEPDLL